MSARPCLYSALSICRDNPYTKTTPITNPNIDSQSNSSSTPAPAPKPTSSSNSSSPTGKSAFGPTSSINNSLSPASSPSNITISSRNNSSSANPPGEINYKPPVSSSPRSVVVAISTTTILVGGVILIAMAILAFKYTQKRRQKRNGKTAPHDSAKSTGESPKLNLASIEKILEEFSQAKPMRFTPQHLQTFTDGYKEKLGSGGFGEVFKGIFPDGTPVAVKVLTKIAEVNEQFLAEVGTIGRTYHINLVRLYGYCFDDKVKALVYEYMEKGSLQACLDDNHSMLGWEKLYQIAIGTARGIRYLHEECEKVIIHYDIKPGNVLLDNNLCPKVADFGMAELWERKSTVLMISQGKGTPGFIAPEASLTVTHKSDVYSFGKFLFQIVGSKMKKLDDCNQGNSASWVREMAGKGEFESILSSCGIQEEERMKVERMCKVALVCAQIHHKARPSMSDVLRMLEGRQEIGVPVAY